jgi:hypothetical protein
MPIGRSGGPPQLANPSAISGSSPPWYCQRPPLASPTPCPARPGSPAVCDGRSAPDAELIGLSGLRRTIRTFHPQPPALRALYRSGGRQSRGRRVIQCSVRTFVLVFRAADGQRFCAVTQARPLASSRTAWRDAMLAIRDLPAARGTGVCGRACRRVQQRCDPSDGAGAECCACGDQFVAYSLSITCAYSHADARGGPGCAAARPGCFSSDDTACCTASSRLLLSPQQRGNLL